MSEKVEWAREEISRRTSGRKLSRKQRKRVFNSVWSEAHRKFD